MSPNRGFTGKSIKYNADALYTRIVKQARSPVFFKQFGVPDTLDGRFDLVVLHVFLVLHRYKLEGEAADAQGQALFDAMFVNMDASLRQIGTGDLSVGKKIKKMATAFYGRIEAYNGPMDAGDAQALAAAIGRNLFRGESAGQGANEAIATYMLDTFAALKKQPLERFCLGVVTFVPILNPSA